MTGSSSRFAAVAAGILAVAVPSTASAAPLAVGPTLQLPVAQAISLGDAALSGAGDALVVYSAQPDCCRSDRPFNVTQRRGPRGAFGTPVQLAPAGVTRGGVRAALRGNGDAIVLIWEQRSVNAGAWVAFVRSGWSGRWRTAPEPVEIQGQDVLVRSRRDTGFDVAWINQSYDSTAAGSVQLARFAAGRWIFEPPHGLPAGRASLAIGVGGAALAVGSGPAGEIWAVPRMANGEWEAPVVLMSGVAPSAFPRWPWRGPAPAASIGRDGSFLASWLTGGPQQASHGWVAHRRPGSAGWAAPIDVGVSDTTPCPTTGATGELAVTWARDPSEGGEGPGPVMVARQATGARLSAPAVVPIAGSAKLSLEADGGLIGVGSSGENVASAQTWLLMQERTGAPIRLVARTSDSSSASAATDRFAFQARAMPEGGGTGGYVGIDRLGPVGLVAPARARAGSVLGVRVNLWRPAAVTVTVAVGQRQVTVRRTARAGRSVVRIRLPQRSGRAVVVATARESSRTPLLRQRTTVSVRS